MSYKLLGLTDEHFTSIRWDSRSAFIK